MDKPIHKNPKELKAFGTHLRKIREEKCLSQQALADITDVAKITIQRIENAKFAITLDTMISIAKALSIPMSDLTNFKIKKRS